MSAWSWTNNGSEVWIGHVGSIEYTESDEHWHCGQYNSLRERCRSLCQDCNHLKHGPVNISENITISSESSYCTASEVSQMQIVDGAVVKCSGYKRKELN